MLVNRRQSSGMVMVTGLPGMAYMPRLRQCPPSRIVKFTCGQHGRWQGVVTGTPVATL